MPEIEPFYPLPPVHVQVYVDALGTETAIDFLLTFGGVEMYFSDELKVRGIIESVVGSAKAPALADAFPDMMHRVPLAQDWLACCLHAQGLSVATIARRLRRSDLTIRKILKRRNMQRAAG